METSRYRRAERDLIAPTPHSGEGWSRPSTAERRGMETSRYRRALRDGIAPTPQHGEGWPQQRRPERDGLTLVPPIGEGLKRPDTVARRGMVSP